MGKAVAGLLVVAVLLILAFHHAANDHAPAAHAVPGDAWRSVLPSSSVPAPP